MKKFLASFSVALFLVMSLVNVYAAVPVTGDDRGARIAVIIVAAVCVVLIVAMIILNHMNKKKKMNANNNNVKDSSSDNAEDIDIE